MFQDCFFQAAASSRCRFRPRSGSSSSFGRWEKSLRRPFLDFFPPFSLEVGELNGWLLKAARKEEKQMDDQALWKFPSVAFLADES